MFATETELESELSRPGHDLVDDARNWDDRGLIVLGAGGKMGTGITTMARRALDAAGRDDTPVTAVSRWTNEATRSSLASRGVNTVTADLKDLEAVKQLPDAGQVVFLVGAKFGTASRPDEAWMINTVLPSAVVRRYASARISALSTGNVYPLMEPRTGGPREDHPTAPVGEYAITCLGREQVFTYGSRKHGAKVALIRLNYACEPRYGVLVDLAKAILDHQPVNLETGTVNVVWQRYANDVVLRSLAHADSPPFVLNLAGPETASVRTVATELGRRLGVEPIFGGSELPTSLLSNAMLCHELFGYPDRSLGQMFDMVTDWLRNGGQVWDKPTKFERRDGAF